MPCHRRETCVCCFSTAFVKALEIANTSPCREDHFPPFCLPKEQDILTQVLPYGSWLLIAHMEPAQQLPVWANMRTGINRPSSCDVNCILMT
mmetsp:Transcript_8747/g.31072  ORF Transcript_8747/g.31072 Transcript_8747/m.31072 type:complete len:92 (+) Transcript_8747:2647-2922(+)